MIFTWFINFHVTFTWFIFTCNFFSQFLYFHVIFFTIQVNFTRLIFTWFFTVNWFFTRLFSCDFYTIAYFQIWLLHNSFLFARDIYITHLFFIQLIHFNCHLDLQLIFTWCFYMTIHFMFFFFTWLIKLNSFDTLLIYFCVHFQREACGFIFNIHNSFFKCVI